MLKSILNNPTMRSILTGQLRHIATVGGTWLATNGYIDGAEVETLVGAVLVVMSLSLSAASKKMAA